MTRAIPVLFCLILGACAQFPELDGTVAPDLRDADFPALVPLESLRVTNGRVIANPAETTQNLEARIAGLRARAAALQRRDIVDASTEQRLEAARN